MRSSGRIRDAFQWLNSSRFAVFTVSAHPLCVLSLQIAVAARAPTRFSAQHLRASDAVPTADMSLSSLPSVLVQTLMHSLQPKQIVTLARCSKWTLQCAASAFAWRACYGAPIAFSPHHDPRSSRLLLRAPLSVPWHPRCSPADFVEFCSSVRVAAVDCLIEEAASSSSVFLDPALQHVRRVTLHFSPSDTLIRAIAALPQLTTLKLLTAVSEDAYAALHAAPHLTELHVHHSPLRATDPSCVLSIVQLPQRLRRLSIGATFKGGEFAALCSSPPLSRLESLILVGRANVNWPVPPSEYAAAFAAMRVLREITLSGCPTMLAQALGSQLHSSQSLQLLIVRVCGHSWTQPQLAPILSSCPALRCRLVFRSFHPDIHPEWNRVCTNLLPRLDRAFPGRVEYILESPNQRKLPAKASTVKAVVADRSPQPNQPPLASMVAGVASKVGAGSPDKRVRPVPAPPKPRDGASVNSSSSPASKSSLGSIQTRAGGLAPKLAGPGGSKPTPARWK